MSLAVQSNISMFNFVILEKCKQSAGILFTCLVVGKGNSSSHLKTSLQEWNDQANIANGHLWHYGRLNSKKSLLSRHSWWIPETKWFDDVTMAIDAINLTIFCSNSDLGLTIRHNYCFCFG